MGDKKKAADTAQEGLEKIPRSKFLRWQLEQLGVKVPPLPEPGADGSKENASSTGTAGGSAPAQPVNDAPAANSTATPPATTTPDTRETGQGAEPKPDTPPAAGNNQDKPAAGTDSQPKNNPYCRFCP
ncbi:MAG: hypothetical protein EPN14_03055 [Gallionella sp.]|nr:MAG: hypothetical protein EPN14_03055 [Gallionella sp.]